MHMKNLEDHDELRESFKNILKLAVKKLFVNELNRSEETLILQF